MACTALVVGGIFFAKWYKGNVATLNDKELLKASEIVKILGKSGIMLEEDAVTDASKYTVTDMDASGNEYQLTPTVYLGKAIGDSDGDFEDSRPPAEHDVRVLIYETKHYVGGLSDKFPKMDDAFGIYDPNGYYYADPVREINGKNIKMVFMPAVEEPIIGNSDDGWEPNDEENEAMHVYAENIMAMSALRNEVFSVLCEKAFNIRTETYLGESEHWRVMSPVEYYYEELDVDMFGYDTSSFSSGYVLFQRKDGDIDDTYIFSVMFSAGGTHTDSSNTGFEFVESDEYPGWYELKHLNYSNFYNNFVPGKTNYIISVTDVTGIPEEIVLVPEGTEYDWEANAVKSNAYKETELYKTIEPAVETYLRESFDDHIDIKAVEIFSWHEQNEGLAAEFSCNVVYNYYNMDTEKVDYLEHLKALKEKDEEYTELYETYKKYYLSPKMEERYLRVALRDPEQVRAEDTVISSTADGKVLCLYYKDYHSGNWTPLKANIEWLLDRHERDSIVYESGSKHVLHTSEVTTSDDYEGVRVHI